MGKNSLKIARRFLLRNGQFTLLNLIGLSTGITCAVLIFLWVNDEWRMDRFNQKGDRLFQVLQNTQTPQGIETTENTPGLLAAFLAERLPEIDYAVPVIPVSWFDKKGIISYGESHLEASEQFVGKDFFNVFSYPLLQGNRNNVLTDKRSILISDELARKLFHGMENVIGKTVSWNQKDYSGHYVISGVFQKPPMSATIQFDMLFNYELFLDKNPKLKEWTNSEPTTYVILKEGMGIQRLNQDLSEYLRSAHGLSKQSLFAQKYSDKYLHNHYENGVPSGGRIEYVRLFSLVAFFILLIACINFMNLTTAQAGMRMKEAAMKKIMGASRKSLIVQFLGESILMAGIAAFIAVLFVMLLLPRFNEITGKNLTLPWKGEMIPAMGLITLIAGLMAGLYPALQISSFEPIDSLKGRVTQNLTDLMVRKGLVVFQFTITGIFIISVLIIYKQMNLVENKDLGYNRDHLVYFDKGGWVSDNKEDYTPGGKYETEMTSFLEQIRSIPGVINVANFRHNITNRNGGTSDISWPGKDVHSNTNFTDLGVGYNFIETMGIQIKEGRSFSTAYGSEKSKIVLNELAIEQMGLKDPVGKTVHLWGEDREIIGVVKNFNFQSLYENIKPCFFDLTLNQRASKIMVRLQGGRERETLAAIENLYKANNQGLALHFSFLDEDYQALYASETRVAKLSEYFAALAIIVSCLGLFGLTTFTAQRRKKEISIRKVVGATVGNMLILLSRDFLKLIVVAVLLAFPMGWWLMNRWLHDFAYRISIDTGSFLIAGALIIGITILTIGFQIAKLAAINPVKSLRAE
jgi:putative ABC transport system permease protein